MKKFNTILCLLFIFPTLAFCQQTAEERSAEANRVLEQVMRQNEAQVAEAYEKMEKEKEKESPEIQQQQKSLMEKAVKALDVRAEIKGKVVDLDGKPISDAKVSYTTMVFNPLSTFLSSPVKDTITTDRNGTFEIKITGSKVMIDDIYRQGYSYQYNMAKADSFIFSDGCYTGPASKGVCEYDPKSTEPYIYYMRKQGQIDYLLELERGGIFNKKKNEPAYPMLLDTWYDKYGVERDKKDDGRGSGTKIAREADPDRCLEISCKFNADYSEFDLVFKTITEGSGVIVTQDMLYEAPESGYQTEVVYHETMVDPNNLGTNGGERYHEKIYIFVQGPDKKFYSRMDMELSTTPVRLNWEPQVRLDGYVYTNPLGRRYLEYDKDSNYNEGVFRKSLNNYRNYLEQRAKEKKEVFDVKAFEKLVDEGKAPQAIEQYRVESKKRSEEMQKEMEARREAELKAAGRWSEDPKERERLRKLYNQEQMDKAKEREEKAKQDSAKEYEAIMQQRGAYRNTKVEDATKKAAENAATEKAGAEK